MNASIYPLPNTHIMPVAVGCTAIVSDIQVIDGSKPTYTIISSQMEAQAAAVEYLAVTAESLLMMPQVGDLVLCVQAGEQWFITQLLQSKEQHKTLNIHSNRPVEWVAPSLRFKALNELELMSASRLTISARDLIAGATQTLVQQAQCFVQKAATFTLNTEGLMQLSGKQQVIVAEEDLRMDGKRINMG